MTLPLVLETMRGASPPRWSLLASSLPQEACFLDTTWVSQVSLPLGWLLCTSALCRLRRIFIASLVLHPSLLSTGGVSSFPSFLNRFFPEVLAGKGKNAYCTYNSQKLQIFTSSYFLAGTAFCCCCSSFMVMIRPVSQLCRNTVLCSCACGVFAGFCISCCFNHRQIMPACSSFALADPKKSFKP